MADARRKLLTTVGGGGGVRAKFSPGGFYSNAILYDTFDDTDSAPMTSPRNCNPGPGVFTVVDTTNKASTAGGYLNFSGVNASGDPRLHADLSADVSARIPGQAMYATLKIDAAGSADRIYYSLLSADVAVPGGTSTYMFDRSRALRMRSGGDREVIIDASPYFSVTVEHKLIIILRSNGAYFIVDGELVWVADRGAVIYDVASIVSQSSASNIKTGEVAVIDLATNGYPQWGADWTGAGSELGIATYHNAAPSANDTAVSTADAVHQFKWTVAALETLEFFLRRTDDTHAWIVRGDQAGSTIKLIEVNGGETERSSVAQTWTDTVTYDIRITADDERIQTYADDAALNATANEKNDYSSASYNKTVTGTKVAGFAAGSEFNAWPRDVSALLPTEFV